MVVAVASERLPFNHRATLEMRERRAWTVAGASRMTVRYRAVRPPDAPLRERLRALAHERRRFCYRGPHVLLRREGYALNHMA